jgi:nickel-dependent lactate racemase
MAVSIDFPYRDVKPLHIPDDQPWRLFALPDTPAPRAAARAASQALSKPYGSPRLRELARKKSRVLIVTDDNTRPTPVRELLPPLLNELYRAGIRPAQVEFVLSLGTHRAMSSQEIAEKLGGSIVRNHRVHNHIWSDTAALECLGTTAQGVPIWVNRILRRFDLVIGVGSIMPIDVCGFSGGGKIVVPGLCGEQTVDLLHWERVNTPTELVLGKAENPIRSAIDEMAKKAGLDFILNVVLNVRDEVVGAFAGDLVAAHREGCKLAREVYGVRFEREFEIVVADSHPFDIEFWQANKALDTCGEAVARGGVIILVTPCPEGLSQTHESQIRQFGYPPIQTIKKLVQQGLIRNKVVGVHMYQVSRAAVEKARLILVTTGLARSTIENLGFQWAEDPDSALQLAIKLIGGRGSLAVLRGAARMLVINQRMAASSLDSAY